MFPKQRKTCLITGATGFIGGHLSRFLLAQGHELETPPKPSAEMAFPDWQKACRNVDIVFHLAGRAHRRDKSGKDAQGQYRQANLEPTKTLARAALGAGVSRFVFASSATVYGEYSKPGEAFDEQSPASPAASDPYAISKLEAEAFLRLPEMAALHPVVVRFPLVYGPGVKDNMRALLRLAQSGLPLPLASVCNKRSFVGIDNLVDFLLQAAMHEAAGGQTLLVSDRHDVSTPELIRAIACGLHRKARLFAFPQPVLKALCKAAGQGAKYRKLCGDFVLDPAWSCKLLDWQPPVSFADGIARMCEDG
jgi:nucleoside-diphosphate-sugar epimerase